MRLPARALTLVSLGALACCTRATHPVATRRACAFGLQAHATDLTVSEALARIDDLEGTPIRVVGMFSGDFEGARLRAASTNDLSPWADVTSNASTISLSSVSVCDGGWMTIVEACDRRIVVAEGILARIGEFPAPKTPQLSSVWRISVR